MTNQQINDIVREEKANDPFKVFKRFNRAFYFPGFGHFTVGLFPKNFLYPAIGILLLILTVNTLTNFIGTLKTSQTLLKFSQEGPVTLLDKSRLLTIKKLFPQYSDQTSQIMEIISQYNSELKLKTGIIEDEFTLQLDKLKKESKGDKTGKLSEDADAALIKERDQKIQKLEKQLAAQYSDLIKTGVGDIIIRNSYSESYKNLSAQYELNYKKSGYKFILIFLSFLFFWGFTVYDLAAFFNFGKLNRLMSSMGAGIAFLAPNISGFLTFTLLPVFASLLLAFSEWDILTDIKIVGLDNFNKLFRDPLFWKYLYNTFYFFINIPIGMAAAIALALAMNQKLKGIIIFRTIYYIPVVSSIVAVALLFRWIYNPDFGLLNTFLRFIGISNPPQWLADTFWAKPAITLMQVWKGCGQGMLLYLAALQGIPTHLYEAADIDGASNWQKFLHITLPLLGPTHFYNIITGVIGTFQQFGAQYVMTQGGPAGSTTTIVYYIYNNAFQWFKMGYASAIAWVLFLMVFIATIINWRYTGTKLYT